MNLVDVNYEFSAIKDIMSHGKVIVRDTDGNCYEINDILVDIIDKRVYVEVELNHAG